MGELDFSYLVCKSNTVHCLFRNRLLLAEAQLRSESWNLFLRAWNQGLLSNLGMANRGATRPNGPNAGNKICQFKLVLLGESAVGKSSLVLRFVKGQFHEFQESTIGGKSFPFDLFYFEFILSLPVTTLNVMELLEWVIDSKNQIWEL